MNTVATHPAAVPVTVGQVLGAAADLVERHGLHRGDYWPGSEHGNAWDRMPVCAGGAIRAVSDPDDLVPLLCAKALNAFADWLITEGHAGRCAAGDDTTTDAAEVQPT